MENIQITGKISTSGRNTSSFIRLNLIVTDGQTKHKLYYDEIPSEKETSITARDISVVREVSLQINITQSVEKKVDNITIFPIKKAS